MPKSWRGYEPGGEEFVALYEKKFPKVPKPKFMMGTIENAVHEASVKKKPLLIYIHNSEKSAETKGFLQNTIANPKNIKLLVFSK